MGACQAPGARTPPSCSRQNPRTGVIRILGAVCGGVASPQAPSRGPEVAGALIFKIPVAAAAAAAVILLDVVVAVVFVIFSRRSSSSSYGLIWSLLARGEGQDIRI